MNISAYQIHNVLDALSKQLTRIEKTESDAISHVDGPIEDFKISMVGNRQAVIDKVSVDIVRRISKYDPPDESIVDNEKIINRLSENRFVLKETEFIYYTIDENNKKQSNHYSVEHQGFHSHHPKLE